MADPIIVKEYQAKALHALLARRDERWILAIVQGYPPSEKASVLYLSEDGINRDATDLGYTPAKVAEYEADGLMKERGWVG